MTRPLISVVIPAYNCADVLGRVIGSLRAQEGADPRDIEIIVVDDASTDTTREAAEKAAKEGHIIYFRNGERLGSGVARNRGIDAATAPCILFLDADNVPAKDCLARHLDFHKRFPGPQIAVLGNPQPPTDVKITPLMALDDVGLAFRGLKHGEQCPWEYFSSMNISLMRSFLTSTRERFNEKVFARTVGFEDTDLGFRLYRKGLRIIFNSKAVSYHYHFRTPEQFLEKVRRYGEAFRLWLDAADPDLLKETAYISGFLPEKGPKLSARYARYALQRIFINGVTIGPYMALAKKLERRSEAASSFLYRRLFNHYFHKGYYGINP